MKKLQDRLREDADDHRDTAHQFDMRPQATVNWQHALNCTEAADTLDRAEQIIRRLLLRVQIGDSAAIEARKFLGSNAEVRGA